MRLIRYVFPSANVRVHLQFRRLSGIKTFIANPRSGFLETSRLGHKSKIKWRGRSFATSVPLDASHVKKSRKKVSKDERKAMVETFVKKYKAMNSGKFPTTSNARKVVGGSHYTIRQFLQELEYNSKMASTDVKDLNSAHNNSIRKISTDFEELLSSSGTSKDAQKTNEVLVGEEFINHDEPSIELTVGEGMLSTQTAVDARKCTHSQMNDGALPGKEAVNDLLSEAEEIVSSCRTVDVNAPMLNLNSANSSSINFAPKDGPQASILVDETESISMKGAGEAKESLHSHPEKAVSNVNEETTSEDMLKRDGRKPKAKQQLSPKLEKLGRELKKEASEGKSSVWENLKSLANGILGIWTKR